MPIPASLNTILENLARQLPAGTNDPTYQNIVLAIDSSPSLASALDAAATKQTLTGINVSSKDGISESGGVINLNSGSVASLNSGIQAGAGTPAYEGALNTYVDLLGHELSHAMDAANVKSDQDSAIKNSQLAPGASVQQTDSFLNQYANIGLQDEGLAHINGWNDVVDRNAHSANPVGLQTLIANNPYGRYLFNQQADGTYVPKPGIIVDSDTYLIDPTDANKSAVASNIKLEHPSTLEPGGGTYADQNYAAAINIAAQLEGGTIDVSYSALGLTIVPGGTALTSLQVGLGLAAYPYPTQITVHDTDDNSLSTFTPSGENGGSVLFGYTLVNADGSRQNELYDYASNGHQYYQISTTIDAQGNATTYAYLSDGTISISNVEVDVLDGATGTVIGNNDTLSLTDSTNTEVSVSGTNDTIKSKGNSIHLLDDNTSVIVDGASNSIYFEGNHQSLTLISGANTIKADSNLVAEDVSGPKAASVTVTAGDKEEFSFHGGVSVNYQSGSNNKLSISDTSFAMINVGDHSDVTIGDNMFAYITHMSNGTLTLKEGDTFNLAGSGNTIQSGNLGANSGTSFIQGDNNTYHGGTGSLSVMGSNGSFWMADGASISMFGAAQGNVINLSKGTIYATSSATSGLIATINGSNNLHVYVRAGTYNVTGDGNAINMQADGGTLNLQGSSNTVDGFSNNGVVNLLSGDDNVIGVGGSQINVTMDTRAEFSGENQTISVTSGNFILSGSSGTFSGTGAVSLTVSGQFDTITESANSIFDIVGDNNKLTSSYQSVITVSGGSNEIHAADQSTINVTGNMDTVYANNATINVGDGVTLTIFGSNNHVVGGSNDRITVTGTNVAVTASNSYVAFIGNNAGDTVTGPGDFGGNWSAPDPDLPPGDTGGYTPPPQPAPQSLRADSLEAGVQSAATPASTAPLQPDLSALIHAMSSFGAEPHSENGLAVPPQSHGDHLQLAAAA